MKCKHCGREILDDSNFCEFCGKKVERTTGSGEGNKKWVKFAVGALIGLMVVGVIGFLIGTNQNLENADSASKVAAVPAGFVDLGLPSGLLWAECNLGATTPEGYGNYYAWGETTPKSDYSLANYRYCNGSSITLTKYCSNSYFGYNGYTDALTTLQAIDDAATQAFGSGMRTPTKAEWEELMNNTTSTRTTQNGVYGRKFAAPNGNTVFLPAAGYRWGSELNNAGTRGYYWSSSLDTYGPDNAWNFCFGSGGQYVGSNSRYRGFSVRAVRSAR